MSYFAKDPFPVPRKNRPHKHKRSKAAWIAAGFYAPSLGVLLPLAIVLTPVLFVWFGILFGTSTIWLIAYTEDRVEPMYLDFGWDWWIQDEIQAFKSQWNRLDRELQHELVDMYHAVYRFLEVAKKIDNPQTDIIDSINERTRVLKEIADARAELKARETKTQLFETDAHAIEIAKLYAESFRQQAEDMP